MDWANGAVSTVALTAALIGVCLVVLNYVWRRDRCLQWFGVSYIILGIGYFCSASDWQGVVDVPVVALAVMLYLSIAFLLLGACEFADKDPRSYLIGFSGLCALFLVWLGTAAGTAPPGVGILPVIAGLIASGVLIASTGYLNAICSIPIFLRATFLTLDFAAGEMSPGVSPYIANSLFVLQAIMLAVAISARYNSRLERDRKRYEREALQDPLTGILNRRGFQTRVEDHLVREPSARHAVVMMDVDNFKAINSLFGHTIGDEVLKDLAQTFERNLRSGDIFGRIGGEEFAMFLPDADLKGAAVIAERLRRHAKTIAVPDGYEVSVSFGVAEMDNIESGIERIHEFADVALKAAKTNGKDCVFLFESGNKVTPWSGALA